MVARNQNIKFSILGLRLFLVSITMLLFWSCSNTKHLKEYESLLIKNKIEYSNLKADPLTDEIFSSTLRPRPNRKILGTRTRLRIYNAMGNPKSDNFWLFIKKNMGEEPVIYNEEFNQKVKDALIRKAHENGFFNTHIHVEAKTRRKKTKIRYKIELKQAYTIGTFVYIKNETNLSRNIDSILTETLIKTGEQYRVNNLRTERKRIENNLKNLGFYNFSNDYLIFEADTINTKVNLKLKLKEQIPEKAFKTYKINNIQVNYDFQSNKAYAPRNSINYDSIIIKYNNDDYIPSVYTTQLFLKKNQQYRLDSQLKSLRYYSNLGVFKFINLVLTEDSTDQNLLNINLYLSSLSKRKFEAEIGFATKSSGYVGPNVNLSLLNRNLFKRAVNYTIKIHAGFEWQYGDKKDLQNVLNLGVSQNLRFPKLFWPFKFDGTDGRILPYTELELKYNFFNYKPYVLSHIINLNLGYFFMNKNNIRMEIRPFNMDYYTNYIIDDKFFEDLDDYPSLKVSLENRFIIGGSYFWVWDSKLLKKDFHPQSDYYYKMGVDLSGNIVFLAQNIFNNYQGANSKFLNMPYSQFVRFENDFRFYNKVFQKSEIATRVIANLGLPYMNSREIPYYKQYFVGGANSIQAFIPRRIGPGGYYEEELSSSSFIKHSGEIWLEVDLEYRFNISGKFDAAIFGSAGNIWLREVDEARPKADFQFNRFYEEIAIGTGFGLRLNYQILVIRLDYGIPLRYPYDNLGGNWIFQHNEFKSKYLFNQSILNFAIGYPF